ncbi:PD-(D/E)XK nuclease family protein [Haloprofundus halophilus]|uniref:PD-(D/E)XK nuclease family protein n=1 Tax=Haloprofundus halophilus TaxID=2283527 RepID=UPI000E430686|nr:PD-(D/E)XK nuclease family protein [Haloprofundus halophilus]
MPLSRAKSIDHLYAAVKDHDLVIVPDAPLASALNGRLDRPHFGDLATTPRRLAFGRREQAEDRLAFLDVVNSTDLNWKETAYIVGNILQCWEHTGRLDAILEYEAFDTEATRTIVETFESLETTSRSLSEDKIDEEVDVAVVEPAQLTTLERSILPTEYDTYDVLDGKPFEHPPFRIFDSPTAIVETLLETIDEENAEEIAIVLDAQSEYSPLVESAFEAEDIPFYGGAGFTDEADHRAFLQLLRATFTGSNTRVSEVRPALERLGISIDIEHNGKRVSTLALDELEPYESFCTQTEDATISEALSAFERLAECELETFHEELETLGIDDMPVSSESLDKLDFYLQTYEVPIERENEGVLLADAKSAAFVGRPLVFYLGLDEGWTHSSPRRPWVDRDEEFERNIRQFQQLIQSGVDQHYLVQDTAGATPVTPCLYFDELLEESFEQFSDLPSSQYHSRVKRNEVGFTREPVDVDVETVGSISQSSLNSYTNSPRDYFFSRLVDNPDKDYFKEGNLFHDFAECYVNDPSFVDGRLDDVVEWMLSETEAFYHDVNDAVRRTKYKIGLETIIEYLDANQPTHDHLVTADGGWKSNAVAEQFGVELSSPLTERWFENDELGVKGKIDLHHEPTQLLDYKSGSKKSAYSIVKHSASDPPTDKANFQALLYLMHLRSEQPGEELEFTFFHFLENLDDVVAGNGNLADTLTTVTYYPQTFDDYVGTEAAYDVLLDGYKDCSQTFGNLGLDAYCEIMGELTFPETRVKSELRESEFATQFESLVSDATSDVDAEKGCDQAIRALNGVRKKNFFKEDLDAFEIFVEECLADLNDCRTEGERFPVEGHASEPNYRYVDHRDLLLEMNDHLTEAEQ